MSAGHGRISCLHPLHSMIVNCNTNIELQLVQCSSGMKEFQQSNGVVWCVDE